MKINEIMESIKDLSYSQGFYGRLYHNLIDVKENDAENWKKIVNELEKQNFKDVVDMVLYFEC